MTMVTLPPIDDTLIGSPSSTVGGFDLYHSTTPIHIKSLTDKAPKFASSDHHSSSIDVSLSNHVTPDGIIDPQNLFGALPAKRKYFFPIRSEKDRDISPAAFSSPKARRDELEIVRDQKHARRSWNNDPSFGSIQGQDRLSSSPSSVEYQVAPPTFHNVGNTNNITGHHSRSSQSLQSQYESQFESWRTEWNRWTESSSLQFFHKLDHHNHATSSSPMRSIERCNIQNSTDERLELSSASCHSSPHPTLQIQPNSNDVLCGRGGDANNSIGNRRFRERVRRCRNMYRIAKRCDKRAVAQDIVSEVRRETPPGRFLRRNEAGNWHDIGNGAALKKTAQALVWAGRHCFR